MVRTFTLNISICMHTLIIRNNKNIKIQLVVFWIIGKIALLGQNNTHTMCPNRAESTTCKKSSEDKASEIQERLHSRLF